MVRKTLGRNEQGAWLEFRIKDNLDDRRGVIRRTTTNKTMSQKLRFEKGIIDDSEHIVDGKS